MKQKRLIIVVLVLAAVGFGIFRFREPLMVRFFPRFTLSRAIGDTFTELETRYAHSPIHTLSAAFDPRGQQKVCLKLDTSTQFMGIAHYDMELSTQMRPNRIRGSGTVSTGAGTMDLSLYMDDQFFAVASESLTDQTYFGINYDTFPQDIRSFQLLAFFAGEETLANWESSVAGFGEAMGRNYLFPELTAEDVRAILMGALTLKPQVEAEEAPNSYSVTFSADGKEIADAALSGGERLPSALTDLLQGLSDNSEIRVVFYLNSLNLEQVDAEISSAGSSFRICAELQAEDTLALELISYDGNSLKRTELIIATEPDEDAYRENISVIRTVDGVQTRATADYCWDLSSGDMTMDLVLDGKKYTIRLNLQGQGESVTLTSQSFEVILSAITGKDSPRSAICSLTVSPGGPVDEVPEYRNLSEWSMDDFWLLLERLGSLVGIKLP